MDEKTWQDAIAIMAENLELKARIKKLEAVAEKVHTHLVYEGIAEGCECSGCAIARELGALLGKGTNAS